MLNIPKVGKPTDQDLTASMESAMTAADPMMVKLRKPIKSHNGELREIKIREPKAGDFMSLGSMPLVVRGGGTEAQEVSVDFKRMGAWAEALTGHDQLILSQMGTPDWFELCGKINSLLLDQASLGN
jgi:hypothetical protein